MKTSYAPANQTLQLDLGWSTMKAELQLRKVRLAFRALHTDNRSRILHDVLRVAMDIGIQWTDEVNEYISYACGSGKWLGNYTNKDELTFTEQWLRRDYRNQ